jgi:hypothetical protein
VSEKKKNDDDIKKQDEKIVHILWIIMVSMITSILTAVLLIKSIGL